jgi:hypothetical protein
VWIRERLRELASLQAVIDRLDADPQIDTAVAGAGTARRQPLMPVQTRGADESALRLADPQAGA